MDILTRRTLLTTTGLAGVAAIALAVDLPGRNVRACRDTGVHDRLAAEAERMMRDLGWAGRNIRAALADITCPGCGEPFIKS
ncbi:MAG: hypothetical protein FJX35_17100 [Alphaproteobacteria bacterium]|nr:hypothetical protein [Alphaproteobacteria bacterium]